MGDAILAGRIGLAIGVKAIGRRGLGPAIGAKAIVPRRVAVASKLESNLQGSVRRARIHMWHEARLECLEKLFEPAPCAA